MIRLVAEDKLISAVIWEEVAPGKHDSDPQFHLARLACDTVLPGLCPACSLPPGSLLSLPANSLSHWPTCLCTGHSGDSGPGVRLQVGLWGHREAQFHRRAVVRVLSEGLFLHILADPLCVQML